MAIFGRMTARQRLRRATRESLAIPAFSAPVDCTPWVTGGLWPAELSTVTAETATLAEYLKADLQRIANGANDQLKMLKRAGMTDPARQAAEARVIEEARGRAVRRVESTIRYLHTVQSGAQPPAAAPPTLEGPGADLERTQVLPAVREVDDVAEPPPPPPRWRPRPAEPVESVEPVAPAEPVEPEAGEPEATHAEEPAAAPDVSHLEETQVIAVVSEAEPVVETPVDPEPEPVEEPAATGRHHAVVDEPAAGDEPTAGPEATPAEDEPADVADASHLEETQVIPVVTDAEPPFAAPADRAPAPVEEPVEPVENGRHHAPAEEPAEDTRDEPSAVSQEAPAEEAEPVVAAPTAIEKPVTPTGFDNARLNRLLEFVVRQEPRLSWAIGDRADGTTVLVTDLAHGWIPSGISLPAGVRLLEPERRGGRVAALIGDTARVVTYAPGDSLRRSADFAATRSSVEPRQLPAIDDLARVLSQATRAHAELPKIVTRLADATAAGTFVVDQEVDVLRVHLDTARYQLLVQYPNVNPGLLLKCMLMAATEGIASGDTVSANYHLAWYRMLAGSTPGG
ncbi:DUF5631 domain-containing protein [Mycobacterium intracellulare]|uniref:DUF5631 domain-containing protein n=1 Tax=Mycobacterium intracellulare TaxID=1767 RepID=UPI001CD92F2E|nr:DUF5631 domain-containing protein [Mycobacterium intracellulare]MCA2359513.1 DUF5632 domain-containing protein [Mycobacterium intracellulare]MCA2369194.1 DUF5632 domain-containing protein [Mycobacterium intracellulare]